MSRQGDRAVRFQPSLDERTMQILKDAGQRLSDFAGMGYDLSPSAVIRHVVIDLLSEELRVLDDLGEPDREVLRQQLRDARACRPQQERK